jgi:phosphoenolpyruvate carboxykinase (GTP)
MRVLDWIIDRCEDKVDAVETAIGFVPKAEDINIEGLEDVTIDTIKELLTVDTENWKAEAEGIEQFYGELTRVPEELYAQLATLKANLNK